MIRKAGNAAMGALLMAAYSASAQGQIPTITTLEIDGVNIVQYQNDITDYTKYATDASQVAGTPAKNFASFVGVGDIVAVNGKPAKGTALAWNSTFNMSPNPAPGQMIADVTRNAVRIFYFEILQADGTPVGTILAEGLNGGSGPPGGFSVDFPGVLHKLAGNLDSVH